MKRYLFLFLVLLVKLSFAQTFVTKASATTIGKNDVVQIEYIAEDVSLDQFVLPRYDKWTLVSGPNLSSSTMQTGNIIKQQVVYSVMLQPNQTGSLEVPGATALINNKPQKSNGVNILVKNVEHLPSGSAPVQTPRTSLFDQFPFDDAVPANQYLKKGEKAVDKIKNNIIVRVEVNKHNCFVGEPILATYKLCTRLRSKSKVVKQPQFSGCTVIELTGDEPEAHVERIKGIDYNVFVIRKVELFPLEAGKLSLPPTTVENRVSFYDGSKMNFRDLYYGNPVPLDEQLVTLQNKPDEVEVKALPPLPNVSNTDFSGGIGNFDVAVSIGDEGLTTNNTNHLYFTVEGEGNLQQVKAPFIKWPQGIETFDVTEKEEDDKNVFPMRTRRTFAVPFVVANKGNYTIPAIQFTYFDPGQSKYITKSSNALLLRVAQGHKSFFSSVGKSYGSEDNFNTRLYIILGGALVAVVVGLVWLNGRPKPQLQAAAKTPLPEIKPEAIKQPETSEYLFKIRELQPSADSSFFYKQLYKNLNGYLQIKFKIEPSQLPFYIEQHPDQATCLEKLKGLLDDCGLGMYTPVHTIEEAMQHRLLAIEVLNNLEKGQSSERY